MNRQPLAPLAYTHSEALPHLFEALGISLIITTYQAQRVLCLARAGEQMMMTQRYFERPTGLAWRAGQLAVGTRRQIWRFADTGALHHVHGHALEHDLVLAPRASHVTGDILVHDLAFAKDALLMVNTRFSCLCTIAPDCSFTPFWRPPFVTALAAEDRCHLNGLAASDEGPQFVTARAVSDTPQGWRDARLSGGIVLHVPSGEIVARGLMMPHSPRLHKGSLYVLDSGRGELLRLDASTGMAETVAALPGFLRGLTFHERFAFVGLCKAREGTEFGGTPLHERRDSLRCGVSVIDLVAGGEVARIEFTSGVEELFDIAVLDGVEHPLLVGMEEDTVDGIFVLPPQEAEELAGRERIPHQSHLKNAKDELP